MFDRIPDDTRKGLWPHQQAALDHAIDHLNKSATPYLIRMPTGTGKTGVIACLTMLATRGSSLILTPWANLREQMVDDLQEDGFWKTVGIAPSSTPVVPMLPSTAGAIVQSDGPKVMVATFATLNDLRSSRPDIYAALAAMLSLVVVDECHYEPAVEWGKSVKGLGVRTVLLTATPYRNDLKLFRITDPAQSTHHFTHKAAVEAGIIRELAFEELTGPLDIPSLAKSFAASWSEAKRDGTLPSKSPRAIVCCLDAPAIEAAVTHLRKAGLNAIGFHEQFNGSPNDHLRKDVPDPHDEAADVWVHQHKLTEGLDDHRFCCLALFTRIRNDRKLIQQIGRVLRKTDGDTDAPALLLAPAAFSARDEWEAYRLFETELKLLEPQHFRDVVAKVLEAQPDVEYFDRRFRRRFRPDELGEDPQVIVAPSVLVRSTRASFSLDAYIEDCTDTLNVEDAVILGPDPNGPCHRSPDMALWVYASVRNSSLLRKASLYQIRLETHCIVIADGLAFITDSTGTYPHGYLDDHTDDLPPDQLGRFLDTRFRPTHVSISSSIPYDSVLRGADLRGHDLLRIAPSLTDHVQVCRSARGVSGVGRRYVGMSNGRVRNEVSEEQLQTYDLAHFETWARAVASALQSEAKRSDLFRRYMPTCPAPANPVPKTICLDLLRDDLVLKLADDTECRLSSSAADIQETATGGNPSYSCSFPLEDAPVGENSISLRIEYQPARQRFWFRRQSGTTSIHLDSESSTTRQTLIDYLNQNQDLVLIGLAGGEIVYQGRQFYKVDYAYAADALLGLIERPRNSPESATEKGTPAQIAAAQTRAETEFPQGSLFRAIREDKVGLPFDDELLICDDLGTECADFVAASFSSRQLALIHAKIGHGSKVSATAFHEVVAQAMKNLGYLTRHGGIPSGVSSWTSGSTWNGTMVPRICRAPTGAPEGRDLWERVQADIIGSSDPGLYVVIVTAGCCDQAELRRAVESSEARTPEIAQLLHLIDCLNGYARQLGVSVLVRDLPFPPSPPKPKPKRATAAKTPKARVDVVTIGVPSA